MRLPRKEKRAQRLAEDRAYLAVLSGADGEIKRLKGRMVTATVRLKPIIDARDRLSKAHYRYSKAQNETGWGSHERDMAAGEVMRAEANLCATILGTALDETLANLSELPDSQPPVRP